MRSMKQDYYNCSNLPCFILYVQKNCSFNRSKFKNLIWSDNINTQRMIRISIKESIESSALHLLLVVWCKKKRDAPSVWTQNKKELLCRPSVWLVRNQLSSKSENTFTQNHCSFSPFALLLLNKRFLFILVVLIGTNEVFIASGTLGVRWN